MQCEKNLFPLSNEFTRTHVKMHCCIRRDSDPEYEQVRAIVNRFDAGIERKWFTIRILVTLFSVAICLATPGIGIYLYPLLWPHVVWASLFLTMFIFFVNIGIGYLINSRVKTLIKAEYVTRFSVPENKAFVRAGIIPKLRCPNPYDSDEEVSHEEVSHEEETVIEEESSGSRVSDSLNTMDAITGGLRAALGTPAKTVQSIRTVDDKPIGRGSSHRVRFNEVGDRPKDEGNSYDPLHKSLLAERASDKITV